MKKVSVIVPVYNVERFLRECVDSILNQRYKDVEVVLVDDESPDNSGKICDEYASKFSNVLVVHKKNGGLSSARNAGMDVATGDYFMFVDSDDFIPDYAVEVMVNEIDSKGADFVTANYINCDEDGTLWEKPIFDVEKYKNFKLAITDYRDSFFVLNSSVCNKIFSSDFIRKNNLRFEMGVPAEDAIFTSNCFICANNVFYLNSIIYYYRQRNLNSISTNCSAAYFKGISKAYKMIYDIFANSNQINFYRCVYAKNMTYTLYKFIDSTLLTDDERIDILSDMRWFYKLSQTLNVPACQKSLSILIQKIRQGQYSDTIDVCKAIADVRLFMAKEEKQKMTKPTPEMYEEIINSTYEAV